MNYMVHVVLLNVTRVKILSYLNIFFLTLILSTTIGDSTIYNTIILLVQLCP